MSEDEKALIDAYYWLSMYKSGATTEVVAMKKVKEVIFEQPQLNENQQQVLEWLKIGRCDGESVFSSLERITCVYEDPKTEEALESLSLNQEAQVLETFSQWALGQEEE